MSLSSVLQVFLTLGLFYLGLFSTVLNTIQSLNGLYCFSRTNKTTVIEDVNINSVIVSGYKFNHNYPLEVACFGSILDSENESYCRKKNSTNSMGLADFDCFQTKTEKNVIYQYNLFVNCTKDFTSNPASTFRVLITTGGSTMTASDNKTSFYSVVTNTVSECRLNQNFYSKFVGSYIAVFVISFVLCLMLMVFIKQTTKSLYMVSFMNPILMFLCRKNFIIYCNPWRNSPLISKENKYKIIKSQNQTLNEFYSDYNYCDESCTYSVINDISDRYLIISHDNQGFFKKRVESSEEANFVVKYLKLKAGKKCISFNHHYPNLDEIIRFYNDGYNDFELDNQTEEYPSGKMNIELDKKLEKHFEIFWGFLDKKILNCAAKGNPIKPRMKYVSNTSWKMYLSDIYYHFNLKPHYKIKKFKKSEAFCKIENGEVPLELEFLEGCIRVDKSEEILLKRESKIGGKVKRADDDEGEKASDLSLKEVFKNLSVEKMPLIERLRISSECSNGLKELYREYKKSLVENKKYMESRLKGVAKIRGFKDEIEEIIGFYNNRPREFCVYNGEIIKFSTLKTIDYDRWVIQKIRRNFRFLGETDLTDEENIYIESTNIREDLDKFLTGSSSLRNNIVEDETRIRVLESRINSDNKSNIKKRGSYTAEKEKLVEAVAEAKKKIAEIGGHFHQTSLKVRNDPFLFTESMRVCLKGKSKIFSRVTGEIKFPMKKWKRFCQKNKINADSHNNAIKRFVEDKKVRGSGRVEFTHKKVRYYPLRRYKPNLEFKRLMVEALKSSKSGVDYLKRTNNRNFGLLSNAFVLSLYELEGKEESFKKAIKHVLMERNKEFPVYSLKGNGEIKREEDDWDKQRFNQFLFFET